MKYFIPIMLLVIFGMNFYVFFRLWHLLPSGKTLLVIVAVVLVSCFFVGMIGGYFLPSGIVTITYRVGLAWFFIALYLFLIFIVLDLLRLVLPMQQILVSNWITLGVLTVSMIAVFTYGFIHYNHKVRVELPLTVEKQITPLKIVAISDLHLGYGTGKTELEKWITLINREEPDVVLIAGDLIDNLIQPLIKQDYASSLKTIKSRYGVYACMGNHEFIGDSAKLPQALDFLQSANITVLRDTVELINNDFYLIGRDDRSNDRRKPLEQLVENLDKTKTLILLDHQPFQLQEAGKNAIDLQISGHTHDGQLPPVSWITKKMYEVSHGYLKKGNSHIYVTSGIGIWGGKFRIGTQSEYVVIELKTTE